MWRSRPAARSLSPSDLPAALRLCATDPCGAVFTASRLDAKALRRTGQVVGWWPHGELKAMVWCGANVVPTGVTPPAAEALADLVTARRAWASSLFGPADGTLALWEAVRKDWPAPREVREEQWSMVTSTRPSTLGVTPDPRLRRTRPEEIDTLLPAAAAMFTEEIGYPPFTSSDAGYRASFVELIARGRSFVITQDDRVLFKADVGSVAMGVAQIQGVWTHPRARGAGIARAGMAAVVETLLAEGLGSVHLYVNDFNTPAIAVYRRIGMRRVGTFATVIL